MTNSNISTAKSKKLIDLKDHIKNRGSSESELQKCGSFEPYQVKLQDEIEVVDLKTYLDAKRTRGE